MFRVTGDNFISALFMLSKWMHAGDNFISALFTLSKFMHAGDNFISALFMLSKCMNAMRRLAEIGTACIDLCRRCCPLPML